MTKKPNYFHVFYDNVANLEEKLNELYYSGYSVVQVLPLNQNYASGDYTNKVDVAIVAINLSLSQPVSSVEPKVKKKK